MKNLKYILIIVTIIFLGAVGYSIYKDNQAVTHKEFKQAHLFLNTRIDTINIKLDNIKVLTDSIKIQLNKIECNQDSIKEQLFMVNQNHDSLKAGQIIIYRQITQKSNINFWSQLKNYFN